ncbi:hypothetical protein ACQPZZ_35655 [Microbispora sp. CA-135349]|uniref:hypothetical protein n=1 Tax=Microbispora sp. CA-135349 TaxID=3239953 RepID=UPI003D93F7C9
MKLTTMTQISVDGVMQNNGAPTGEHPNGFERGGWALGKGDDETRTFITQTYQQAEAFLFGRRTYELFAGSWGSIDQMRAHPIGVALNPGRVARRLQGRDDSGLPAGRAPAVCAGDVKSPTVKPTLS